jgi:hypothetical protein
MRLETFHNITKEQEILQQKRGHYKFEPQHLTQDDTGNIYWNKWKDRPALQVNDFRVWISNDDGVGTVLVNVKDLYTQRKELDCYYQTVIKQIFR